MKEAVPVVGSRWIWEPDKPHAREVITVTAVSCNENGEWWVETACDDRDRTGLTTSVVTGKKYWNDLSRFWEAVVPVGSAP